MAQNKMQDLQNHLFATIELLRSGEMKPEVAREINNVGRTLLDSAKVEIKYMETLGLSRASTPLLAGLENSTPPKPALPEPVITYRCRTATCGWEGRQKEKDLVRDGADERRVCPHCKKDQFWRLVNGMQEAESVG